MLKSVKLLKSQLFVGSHKLDEQRQLSWAEPFQAAGQAGQQKSELYKPFLGLCQEENGPDSCKTNELKHSFCSDHWALQKP